MAIEGAIQISELRERFVAQKWGGWLSKNVADICPNDLGAKRARDALTAGQIHDFFQEINGALQEHDVQCYSREDLSDPQHRWAAGLGNGQWTSTAAADLFLGSLVPNNVLKGTFGGDDELEAAGKALSLSQAVSWLADARLETNHYDSNWQPMFRLQKTFRLHAAGEVSDQNYEQSCLQYAVLCAAEVRRTLAEDELTKLVADGKLEAWGFREFSSLRGMAFEERAKERSRVPPELFLNDIKLLGHNDSTGLYWDDSVDLEHREYVAARNSDTYSGIRFNASSLLRCVREELPASIKVPNSETETRAQPQPKFSRAEVERAYQERIKGWPKGSTPAQRSDDEKWGKENFNAPREFVRELRSKYAPENWKESGRRPAKS